VLDRLERLARLYLDLAASWLKVPRISSAVTYAGFEMMTDFDVDITLTDDQTPLSEDAKAINPGGGDVVQLPARKLPLIAPPGIRFWFAEEPSAEIARHLTHIARVAISRNGAPLFAQSFEAQLRLDGVDHFQAQLGVRLVNRQLPKTSFNS